MSENNDVELATRIRAVQTIAGSLDSVMANGGNHDVFRSLLHIVEEAQEAMYRLNRLNWPVKIPDDGGKDA